MDKTPSALVSRDSPWERPYCHPGWIFPSFSVVRRFLMFSSSMIRKSLCLVLVAHAELSVQNACSMGFMADLMWECMLAIVLSHRFLASLHSEVFLKLCIHWSVLKKADFMSCRASSKSSSNVPKLVKNETLATSLI